MDEVLVLHLSQDAEPSSQGVDGVDDSSWVLGELFPRHVRLSTGLFKNGSKVLFDKFEVDRHICEIIFLMN